MPWGRLHLFSYQSLALFTLKSHKNSQYVVVIQLETYAIIVFVCGGGGGAGGGGVQFTSVYMFLN